MGKRTITYSLDVEASGAIPGPWWMCSFGICKTEDVSVAFHRELSPLNLPGISMPDNPRAMEVVVQGLPDLDWDPELGDEDNVARVRGHFETQGLEPRQALADLRDWLKAETGNNRPVIVGSPVTFDFMWLYWYWWQFLEEMPIFGFSGLDIRSYFMGSHGVGFMGTGKQRYLKHYPNEFQHTHHPVDDARQQGQIWHDMVQAREARGR